MLTINAPKTPCGAVLQYGINKDNIEHNEKKEPPDVEAPSSISALQKLLSISHSREEIVQKKNGETEADF